MPIPVSQSIQNIFDTYKEQTTNPLYYPASPAETLKSRLTALWLLQNEDPDTVLKAEAFLGKTSRDHNEELDRLKLMAGQIASWDEFRICSVYENYSGLHVEYSLKITNQEHVSETIHRHACYHIQEEQCFFVSETPPLVRVIGDPVLHQPGKPFPVPYSSQEYDELMRQRAITQDVLIQTGGAGIAANQCAAIAEPYQLATVGVFYDSPEHVAGVRKRYPTASFPEAITMVNPHVIECSTTLQKFSHGCLSVPSPNRCDIQSPEEITLQYLDAKQHLAPMQITMRGIDAVALWHEVNHIVDGKTYIDTALSALSPHHLKTIEDMVTAEKEKRRDTMHTPELSVPPFYLTVFIDEQDQSQLDTVVFQAMLPHMTDETLAGFAARCQYLKKKLNDSYSEYSKNLFNALFGTLIDYFPLEINSTHEPVAKLFRALVHYVTREQADVVEIATIFALIQELNTSAHEIMYQKIQKLFFTYMATKEAMMQNKLQMICHHYEQDISLLQLIMDVLTAEQCAKLFSQRNAKGWNVIAVILYYCSNSALEALLPCSQKLKSDVLKKLLMQELSYTTLPRYAACAKPKMLPYLMILMERLDSNDLEALIETRDHHGFTLLHYVVFYCPQHLKKLLQLVETLAPQSIVNQLNTTNQNGMSLFMSVKLTNNQTAFTCLLETVNKLEEPFRSAIKDVQDSRRRTVCRQAASSSSFGVFSQAKILHDEKPIGDETTPSLPKS